MSSRKASLFFEHEDSTEPTEKLWSFVTFVSFLLLDAMLDVKIVLNPQFAIKPQSTLFNLEFENILN